MSAERAREGEGEERRAHSRLERAIKASSVEWPREIPPTDSGGREGQQAGRLRRQNGECERADSDDSIEKRAMSGGEWMSGALGPSVWF